MAYVKTSWKTGDTVTSTKLNKIEQGIYDNDAAIADVAEDVSDIQAAMVVVDATLSTTGKAADAKATGDALAAQSAAIKSIESWEDIPIPFTVVSTGFIRHADGTIGSSTETSYTDYIDISSYVSISYKRQGTAQGSATGGIAFYNSNKAYVSGVPTATNQSGTGYLTTLNTVSVPTNAVYVRFNVYTDTQTYGNFEAFGTPILQTIFTETENQISQVKDVIGFENVYSLKNNYYGIASADRATSSTTSATVEMNTTSSGVPVTAGHTYLYYVSATLAEGTENIPTDAAFVAYLRNRAAYSNIAITRIYTYYFTGNEEAGDKIKAYGTYTPSSSLANVGGYALLQSLGSGSKSFGCSFDKVYLIDITNLSSEETSILIKQLNELDGNKLDVISNTSEIQALDKRVSALESGAESTVDIIFWGDSLTAGAGGNGTTFPNVCATELNATYKNCGVGGESANTISARQGGNAVMIPAGDINGTYQSLTDIYGVSIAPLVQGSGGDSGNKLYINGDECTLSYSDSTYTISGYTKGTSAVPMLGKFAGSDFNGKATVIFVGANGGSIGSGNNVNALMTIIDSMIAHIKNKQYVVFTEWKESGTESYFASDDAAMLAHYGNNLFPMRKMLVNYGLDLMGITPTEQDTTDIAAGTIPSSLRSDNIHLNADGYTAVGKLLADKIRSLGYV